MISPGLTPNRASRRSRTRNAGAIGAGALLVTGSAAALLTALAGSAAATATITVDSNADGAANASHCTDGTPNNCTLRDAAAAANDGDTIVFDPSVTSITLTQGRINLDSVSLHGHGSSSLAITTTAAPGAYTALYFDGESDVVISGFSLSKNRIFSGNAGTLTVVDVAVSGSTGAYGGALYAANTGDLEITDSRFDSNIATARGGAVYIYNTGDVLISGSTFTNSGSPAKIAGGIDLSSRVVDVTITGCTITGNVASHGAGIHAENTGNLTIADSTIASNDATVAGGGVNANNDGTLTISDTTIDSNDVSSGNGAGVRIGSAADSATIANSTISNNVAYIGGGVAHSSPGPLVITNSTLTGNGAVAGGGALYVAESTISIELDQDTISGNRSLFGGAGMLFHFSNVSLSGTIISANTNAAGDEEQDIYGFATISSNHSIIGSTSDFLDVDDLGGTIRTNTPGLMPLAANGGPTMTMALETSSVAIDAGPDPVAVFTGNGFDQRGAPWVRIYNGVADIGAFEYEPGSTPSPDPVVPAFTG